MSRYITKRVLALANHLLGFGEGHHTIEAWGEPHSQEYIVVPCPFDAGMDGLCTVYLNRTLAVHFYDGEADPWRKQSFEDFEAMVEAQSRPWRTVAGMEREVEAESALRWIWHGYLLPGALTLLSASPKVGKTTLIFDALEAILSSRGLLGLKTRPADILYVTEESAWTLLQRIDEMSSDPLRLNPRVNFMTRRPGLTWEQTMGDIARFVSEHADEGTLVIIDTMGFWLQIENENDASQVRRGLQPLVDLARTSQTAVLLIHHSRKSGGTYGEGVRGSTAFTGNVDIIIEMERDNRGLIDEEAKRHNPRRRLTTLSRYGKTPGELVVWRDAGPGEQRYHLYDPLIINKTTTRGSATRPPWLLLEEAEGA